MGLIPTQRKLIEFKATENYRLCHVSIYLYSYCAYGLATYREN